MMIMTLKKMIIIITIVMASMMIMMVTFFVIITMRLMTIKVTRVTMILIMVVIFVTMTMMTVTTMAILTMIKIMRIAMMMLVTTMIIMLPAMQTVATMKIIMTGNSRVLPNSGSSMASQLGESEKHDLMVSFVHNGRILGPIVSQIVDSPSSIFSENSLIEKPIRIIWHAYHLDERIIAPECSRIAGPPV